MTRILSKLSLIIDGVEQPYTWLREKDGTLRYGVTDETDASGERVKTVRFFAYTVDETVIHVTGAWSIAFGTHRGTVTSRDQVTLPDALPSLEACREVWAARRATLVIPPYHLWYAIAYAPDGTPHQLEQGTSPLD